MALIDMNISEESFNDKMDSLYVAISADDTRTCKRLLGEGLDVNVLFKKKTPLIHAVQNGRLIAASFLINKGADINKKDAATLCPLYYALRGRHYAIMDFLISKGCDVNARDSSVIGDTCVGYAAEKNMVEGIEKLIKAGCNVNIPENDSPLHRACQHGHANIVQLLINNGADANQQNFVLKNTPLHVAVHHGNLDIVKALVPVSNVDVTSVQGQTALHTAVMRGNTEAIKLLVQAGWNVNFTDKLGMPPLFLARSSHDLQSLVELDCDLNQKVYGCTFLRQLAEKKGESILASIMLQAGADPNIPQDGTWETPLHTATHLGNVTMCRLLLQYGADPSLYDSDGRTAIQIAACEAQVDLIQLYLGVGERIPLNLWQQNKVQAFLSSFITPSILGDISQKISSVVPLQDHCRQALRRILINSKSHNFKGSDTYPNKVDKLPLPGALQLYMKYDCDL